MATTINHLLSLLNRVKARSDGQHWDACCPAHDDQHASLSVGLAEDGRILLKCQRGCPTESVLQALGFTWGDLFPDDAAERNGGPRIETTYDYADEAGVILYQTVRYYPKDFKQRRPDGKGGWIWNLQGVPRVLYRLPELLAADLAQPVFVVEGEKDVERLRREGLTATTNALGAGKWRRDYNEAFRGRQVVILPDNDQTGTDHAAEVLRNLDGLAATVRVLPLPGLAPKGDVSDWFNAGGTREQLLQLLTVESDNESLPEMNPEEVATIEDLIRAGAQVSWIWKGWIPRGVLTAIAAKGGTGKTRFCADLLRRIRHRQPWPDGSEMEVSPDALALWVVADNHHDEMVTLALDFDIAPSIRINATKADPYGGVTLESEADYRELEARIRAVKPLLVIIDTVGNATDKNLSKQEDAKAFYWPLQIIARRNRVAILCLTHLNATGQFLGRRVLEKVRLAIRMEQYEGDEKRRLEVHKSNSKRPAALGLTMGDNGNDYDDNPPEPPALEPGAALGSKIQKAIDWLRSKLTGAQMRVSFLIDEAKEVGISLSTLYRAKDTLKISESTTEGRKWWSLISNDELPE